MHPDKTVPIETPMNKTEALNKLWQLLTDLIDDKARIRRLAEESGIQIAEINPDGAATEYWWRVLGAARRDRKVDKIVAAVGEELKERKGELDEAYRLYADATDDVAKTPISPIHSDYLHSLFDRWGAVRLADILDKLNRQVRLLDVYVPLPIDAQIRMKGTKKDLAWWFDRGGQEADSGMTRQTTKHADRENRPRTWPELGINDPAQLEPLVRHLWDKRQPSDEVSVRLDAEHAAALQPRLVLLGGPGSGKSSFLRHLTLCLAGAMLHAAGETPPDPAANLKLLPGWSAGAYTPIYIELRDLIKFFPELPDPSSEALPREALPGIEVFWTYLREKEGKQGAAELRSLQRQGKIMVLLDGLDEVNRAHERARMRQIVALVNALQTAKIARILIASRPHAYTTVGELSGFGVAQLVPLDRDRQKLLADTLLRQLPGAGSTADLMAAIDAAQVNDDMRENPLFFTLWVGLWCVSSTGVLPATKAGLYRAAVDLLLSKWTRPKNPDPAVIEAIGVEPLKLRPVLEALACKTLTQQGEDFALSELLDLLDQAKGNPDGGFSRKMHIDEVDDYLERHAGILVAPRYRHYRFIHRSFQEHLAACELIHLTSPSNHPLKIPSDNLFPDGLLAKLQQDSSNWRNVARLAISELIVARRLADLRNLLEAMSGPYAEDGRSWPAVALLALEMVNDPEMPKLPERDVQGLRSAALRALHDVTAFPVPKERAIAGNALSRLGDRRRGVGVGEDGLPDIAWLPVEAGEFPMGSNAASDEKPIHPVDLNAFAIAKYPITNSQYACFVAATGRKPPEHWRGKTPPDELRTHPVVNVSWEDVAAFCDWLSERCRAKIRLPTEAEWEKAARGTDGRTYPWGNESDKIQTLCNMNKTGIGGTSPVGIFPAGESPYKVAEMAGNVWEWVNDWYDKDYYRRSPRDNPPGPERGPSRVLRGGSWNYYDVGFVRSANRYFNFPDRWFDNYGFRCVRSL